MTPGTLVGGAPGDTSPVARQAARGGPAAPPKTHGQQGLGAVQSLDLGLLIDAEHYRLVGRIQVQADDVADLFDKERVCGELEVLRR